MSEKRCYITRNLTLLNLLIETRDLVFKMILIISRNNSKGIQTFFRENSQYRKISYLKVKYENLFSFRFTTNHNKNSLISYKMFQ